MERTTITIFVVVSIAILVVVSVSSQSFNIIQIKKASAAIQRACTAAPNSFQCEEESQKAMQALDVACKDLKTKDVNSTAYAKLSQELDNRCP